MNLDSMGEFLGANAEAIEAITSKTAEQLSVNGIASVVTKYRDEAPQIVSEEPGLREIGIDLSRLEPDEAEELQDEVAEIRCSSLLSRASVEFVTLSGATDMFFTAEAYNAAPESERASVQIQHFDYEKAEYVGRTWGDDEADHITLETATLFDASGAEVAKKFTVQSQEAGLLDALAIVSIRKAFRLIDHQNRLAADPLNRRAIEILGSRYAKAFSLMMGAFEKEHALDAQLSNIWTEFVGSAQEDEVGPLLDEIRVRAVAVKESMELSSSFGTSIPSAEKLREFVAIFDD